LGSYRPLFNIEVNHGFFADGLCPCLDFVASEQTERIIKNTGLLVRKSLGGIGIVYDQSSSDALLSYVEDQAEPLFFDFKVYSNDPAFKSYTEPFSGSLIEGVLYFDNQSHVSIDNKNIRLHASEYVTSINSEKFEALQVREIFTQKERLIPPLFIVRIYASGKEGALFPMQVEMAAKNYYLSFKSRNTIWKYYLLGAMAKNNVYVLDLDGGVEFEFSGETPLADARTALIFRSISAIPLRQKQDFRFQLRERSSEGDRVLIKRLPVATIGQFGKEIVSGQGIVVSEIYING
jgi:hypothetical protein